MLFPGEKEPPRSGTAEQLPSPAQEALAKAKQAVDDADTAQLAFFQQVLEGDRLNDDQKTLFRQLQQDASVDRFDAVVYPDPVTGKDHTFREYFIIGEERGEKVYEPAFNEAIKVIEKRMVANAQLVEAQKRVENERQQKEAERSTKHYVVDLPGGWRAVQAAIDANQAAAAGHLENVQTMLARPIPTPEGLRPRAMTQNQPDAPLPGSGQEVGMWDKKDLPAFGEAQPQAPLPVDTATPEVQAMVMPEASAAKKPSIGQRFRKLFE